MTAATLLITGCSSGIGLHAAHAMQAAGWRVVASCRKQDDVDRLTAEGLDCVRIDYEDEASIHAGFDDALARLDGRLDALFNNGAYAIPGLVEDLTTDALRTIFEANFFGWHTLSRRAVAQMRGQQPGAGGSRGRIVQNSSVLGFVGLPYRGSYCATKFALEGLTDCMRQELRDAKIECILIEPGPITTDFRKNAAAQFHRWIDWRASALATDYETKLIPRLVSDEKDRWQLEAEAVTAKLRRALESRRPRARYYVTTPTYTASVFKRLTPSRLFDRLVSGA